MIEYNGLLTEDTQRNVREMANRYPYAVEINRLPDGFDVWCYDNMKLHYIIDENCQGQPSCHSTHLWALVQKNGDPKGTRFIFFSAVNEREAFLRDFPESIINAAPFAVRF